MFERYEGQLPHTPTKIHYIETEEKVDKAVAHLLKFDVLGFDLETYHSVDRHIPAFDPCNGARMRLAQFATPEGRAFVFNLYKVRKEFLYRMFPNPFLCVIQNAKFELKFLQYEMGIYDFGDIWDTMIAEQILSKGHVSPKSPGYVPVGLDRIADRTLGVTLPKDEQAGDWYLNDLSERQIAYAARDAVIVLPIYQSQRDRMVEQSQVRVAELEFNCTPALASMENNGMYLNGDKWLAICDETKESLEVVKKELWQSLGSQGTLFEDIASINLDSKQQVQAAMLAHGIDIPFDKDGNQSLNVNNIGSLTRPEVVAYLKYTKLAKSLSSYGPDWLDKKDPFDGRIHCQLKQIGAETGRMAASGPNLMQMKKDERYRNAFEAAEGWVFIDADYSQCELRILAEYCRDPNMLEAFDKNYDLHQYSAHLIYQIAMEIVEKWQRGVAKNLNFGIVYGIGVAKFAAQAGIPLEDAERIMNYYLKQAYPQMGYWLENQGRSVLYNMEARTMTGRIRRYTGDLADKQFKAGVQRNAKNLPIQGTNADITKRALALLYQEVKGQIHQVKMVMVVHDEIIIETTPAYAAEGAYRLQDCMLRAEREYLHRVPSVVDCGITLEWCKDPTKEQLAAAAALLN